MNFNDYSFNNNGKKNLANQICAGSGLQGAELEALRTRLSKLSETELQAELCKQLSGDNSTENKGLIVERSGDTETTLVEIGTSNEIVSFNGDELAEKRILSADENGNITQTVITYENNRPVKLVKSKNGNTVTTTTFTYHEGDDKTIPYVVVKSKNADNSSVTTTALEVSVDGEITNEDIVDRTTVAIDGTKTTIYYAQGNLLEQKDEPNGKNTLNLYNGTDISSYDRGELNLLGQQIEYKGKVYYAEYDGQGNTKTVTQDGESPALIAQRFNVKENALRRLNPLRKNPHGHGKIDPLAYVGEEILINGQYSADSKEMRNRKSKEENLKKYAREEYARRAQGLYSTEIKQETLSKNYNGNYWALAKDMLGNTATKAEIDGLSKDLQLLNGDNTLKSGMTISVPGQKANGQNVKVLSSYGFKPSKATHGFYEKFNKLSENEQQMVLSTVKYLKSQNITDPKQIKTEIMQMMGINLFDSEKVIHMQGSGSGNSISQPTFGTQYVSQDVVSLETYITDYLGLDMNSEVGKQVYLRLNSYSQEELNKLSANDFTMKGNYAAYPNQGKPTKALSGQSFDEVADVLSSKGINIRTQGEMQAILSSPQYKKQQEEITFRENAAQNVGLVYDQAISEIKAYKDSQGWINVGYWREKLGNLIKNDYVDTSFEATIERLEREKQFAISRLRSCSNSETAFNREFKAVTGVEYNETKIKKFLEEASKEGNDWSASYKEAYGSDIADWAKSRVNTVSTTDGICDIAAMLVGTEAIAGTTVFKGTVAGVSKQIGKVAGTKGTQVLTSMAAGGLNLGSWTLLSGTVNNLTKNSETTVKDWENLGWGTLSSVGFGAAGGLLNTTVVDKVIKGVSKVVDKPAVKAVEAIEKSFEKGSVKTGTEIMSEYMKAASPGYVAKAAGFATEVGGFTVYETAVDICKDFFTEDGFNEESMRNKLIELGKAPEEVKNLSGANLVALYLVNTAWGQVKMLGEVKGIANLMMMRKGGKVAQKLAYEENIKESESLKDIKVRPVEINGREVFEVTYPDGNRAVASSVQELVGNFHVMMQLETLTKIAKLETEEKAKVETKEQTQVHENDQINHILAPDEGIPLADKPQGGTNLPAEPAPAPREPITSLKDLIIDEHISNSEANAILRERGLSEQDIASLRNEVGKNFNALVETFNIMIRISTDESLKNISVEELKQIIKEVSQESNFEDYIKLYNERTIQEFKDKFSISEENEIFKIFEEIIDGSAKIQEYDQNIAKAMELSDITGLSVLKILDSFSWASATPERIESLTPERLQAQKSISEALGIEFRLFDAEDIKNPERVTPEFVQDLKIQVQKLKQLGVDLDYGYNDPVDVFTETKEMIAKCEKAGLDFSWYKATFENGVSLSMFKTISSQRDLAKVKSFIDACTPEAKEKFPHQILDFASNEARLGEEYIDLINTLGGLKSTRLQERYGYDVLRQPGAFVSQLENVGITDIKGVASLLRAFDEVGNFPSSRNFMFELNIKNGDYANAAKFVRQLKEVYGDRKNTFHYGYDALDDYMSYRWKPDIDFKRAVERMDDILKSEILNDENNQQVLQSISTLVRSDNPQAVELFKLLTKYGFTESSLMTDIISNKDYNLDNVGQVIDVFEEQAAMQAHLPEVPAETVLKVLNLNNNNHNNMYLLKHMIDSGILDYKEAREKIGWHYNFDLGVTPENKALITRLFNDKELAFILYKVPGITRDIRPDNIELVTRLCTDKELNFPLSKVSDIADSTRSDNIELITRLCTDKELEFPLSLIPHLAGNTRSDNIELVTRLCTDKELGFPNDKIVAVARYTNPENIELITRLCTDKELNFPADKLYIASNIRTNDIEPKYLAQKLKDFIDSGLDEGLIIDIVQNAKTFSIFSYDVVGILKRLKAENADVTSFVSIISEGILPETLPDKINSLITLAQLTPEEKLALKKQGIDIDGKISALTVAIDKKYPTISTSKEGIHDFLQHIGNNRNADAVIQSTDFAQFGKKGIPLEYSREDFMQNMDKIAKEYLGNNGDVDLSGVRVPELVLSEADAAATKAKIEELKANHETEEVEIILEGKKLKGTRFLNTQGGSNTAYYTQIGDKLYYIKYPEEAKLGQSVEEVLASRLYRAAGIDSPNMEYVYDANGKIIGMAGEYVPSMSETPLSKEQVTDGFAVDAWLANWDAPKNDNTQYRDNGVIKVDVGGSLHYRARGALKDFSSVVSELSTLIEQNSQFMSMTKEELLSSLKHVTDMPEEQIYKIIQDSPLEDVSLINTLLKRKEYMTIFAKKLAQLDSANFKDILEMVNEAKVKTAEEFTPDMDVAHMLGYVRTKTGFEGMLNTQNLDNVGLTPAQREMADKMIAEIEKFTKGNKIADGVNLSQEAKDFINSILKGVPEFAPFFGKPQHSGQKYSLDVHILKVLQDSLNDPKYQQLSDTDKIVLKFSALLHDIGKRYLIDGSDTGHAEKSAEYVYSILDKFNLRPEIKDRIISIVENHHWFKAYNKGLMSAEEVATLCRRPEDFLIYQIMAKADLKNVSDTFFMEVMKVSSLAEAEAGFAHKMAEIEPVVNKLSEKQVVITASKFVEVPERTTSSGKVLPAREFPKETTQVNGVDTEFKVLNLSSMDENTDMFQFGFNKIPMKDLRLLVHMVHSNGKVNLEVFKTLAQNPMNNSAQSISMISMADKATYSDYQYGLVLDLENANVSHAYYANTGSGTKKGFSHFVKEMFEEGHHRSFVKDSFKSYMKQRGIELSDVEYSVIAKYIMGKQYPETQIRGVTIGDRSFSKEDILGAFTYSRDQLIEMKKQKTHGSHNEIVGLNSKIRGVVAKCSSLQECPQWFLEFARDNNLPIILIGT